MVRQPREPEKRPKPDKQPARLRKIEAPEEHPAPAAEQAFAALPLTLQRRLTAEIVVTRGAELRRAYKDVKAVAAGFRTRQHHGQRVVTDEPCVVFVLRKKRSLEELEPQRPLPRHLLAYAELDGVRRLCAVPTDIDEAPKRRRVSLHASIDVRPADGGEVLHGSLACAIERELEPGVPYLVSCRHVFGHPTWYEETAASSVISLPGRDEPIAEADGLFFGRLGDGLVSCDVQLGRIMDPAGCREALGHAVFDDHCREEHDIVATRLFILSTSGAIPVDFKHVLRDEPGNSLDYLVAGCNRIVHASLIEMQYAGEPAGRGDSGSAIATRADGGLLVGMFIANSEDKKLAYAVPAWDLLKPGNYDPDSADETWRLLPGIPVPATEAPAAETSVADFEAEFTRAFPGATITDGMREGVSALRAAAAEADVTDKSQIAYILGTCWHETGGRMEPVREAFGANDDEVARRLDRAFENGQITNRYWDKAPNGQRYYGRGYIQLTFAGNYSKVGRALGVGDDFVDNPDLVMEPATSAKIAVIGMRDGLFRPGNRLSGFDLRTDEGRREARAIVNSRGDRATEIAEYAKRFLSCLA
ncbi:glycoside hydrolase family 19 protein [Azospirillum sp. B4]|uniref:glycoside hydrolase family 19 protein n=1 Tax=Azospirillum sp. B4 TaxID=95605 RepID=UPI0003456C34|nr:glycoside hydrolase family 19 protein [Azospirillum sp. B4]